MALTMAIGCFLGLVAGTAARYAVFSFAVPRGTPRRTACPTCGTPVLPPRPWTLFALPPHGRCPGCRTPVGAPAMLPELLGAAWGVVTVLSTTSGWDRAALGWAGLCGLVLVLVDGKVRRLPDPVTAAAAAGVVALITAAAIDRADWGAWARAGVAACVLGLGFLTLALVARFGIGDAKAIPAYAFLLGWYGWRPVVLGVIGGFMLAGAWAAVLLLSRRRHRSDLMAFGPFLVSGALAAAAFAA